MLFCSLILTAALSGEIELPAGPGPLNNPMKGFASYCEPGAKLYAPTKMAFEEIGWNRLEPSPDKFGFDEWESKYWDKAPAKGKDLVLRVYLDYPSQPCATPSWLIAKGVKMTSYTEFGGGLSPDYSNPTLQRELLKFIKAFGARYDKDPRVAIIQVGLLGHWGEWHTYPHEQLFASPAVQRKVIEAMRQAFPHKGLEARNASYSSCQVPWIGFHDDMIPSDTFGKEDWEFLPAIEKGGVASNWKVAPLGGEMVPGAAKQYLGSDWPLLMRSVRDAHFSWIGPYCPAMEPHLTDKDRTHIEELIRALGYQFQLKTAKFPGQAANGSTVSLGLAGTNEGAAPFYRPWPVRWALLDANDRLVQSWAAPADIRKWLPGPFQTLTNAKIQAPPGEYRIAVGVVNPDSGQAEIEFANQLPTIAGYAVLGKLEVVKPLTN